MFTVEKTSALHKFNHIAYTTRKQVTLSN